ncbi:MAG: hypothetical protein PHI48_06645 [Bacteroidales bacterium]|nr:hypothetical protein [Bacteroidales bacterium]
MGYLLSTTIKGWIGSLETFISGFAGEGWRIWNNYTDASGKKRWKASFDDLEVRGSFNVFELIVSKIRAIIGALGITQACGKIKEVTLLNGYYRIKVEDEMSFMQNDFIRYQRFSSDTLKQRSYWVKVFVVVNDEILIPYEEFTVGEIHTAPQVGDDIVQFGNETNTARQSAIYIHADEDGSPAIDILYGINSKSFEGCVKVKLGTFIDNNVSHVGLMCVNGLLKSVNVAGEEIYKINPDGSAFFAKGQVGVNSDGSGYIFKKTVDGVTKYGVHWDSVNGFVFGEDVKLSWNNLSAEAQTNLKGDPGQKQPYYQYDFSNSTSTTATGEPAGVTWTDAPPAPVTGQYLWMRTTVFTPKEDNTGWDASLPSYTRLSGLNGSAAPQVRAQYSINGVDYWHTVFVAADIYMRLSYDNGSTWTSAVRIVGEKGSNAPAAKPQYSTDATSWHDTFTQGDIWMHLSVDGGTTYGSAVRIVGEKGDVGADGKKQIYYKYDFSYSPSLSGTPTGVTWVDAPPAAVTGQYLWMRTTIYTPKADNSGWDAGTPTYSRLGGEKGTNAPAAKPQYSVDGSTLWHDTFTQGDVWMHLSVDGGTTYGSAVRIVGEKGDVGANGQKQIYYKYDFSYSASLTGTPTGVTWVDAPPAAVAGQYLWMRTTIYTPKADNSGWDAGTPTYSRLGGEKGTNAPAAKPQYSVDGSTSWHDTFAQGDIWMHLSVDGGTTYGSAVRIVGEKGDIGADGQKQIYYKYDFSYSPSLSGTPTGVTWVDAPPAAVAGQYLWMRTTIYTPKADNTGWDAGTPTYSRLGGENGSNGTSPYQLILSNQMASIVLKSDGTLDYSDAVTTPTLYYGLNTVPNVTYAVTAQEGVAASITNGVVSVTSVTNDYTNIEITATLQGGSTPVAKILFKVVKVKNGVYYQIIPSVRQVKKDKTGSYSVPTISFNVYKIEGNVRKQVTNVTTDKVKMVIQRDGVNRITIDGYGGNSYNFADAVVLTAPEGSPMTSSIVAKLYPNTGTWNDADMLDMQTIPLLIDGADGNPGSDANLLPWVQEWNSNQTEVGSDHLISPKIFSGTKDETTGALTGVALGREVVMINGVAKTGVFGLKNGVLTFFVDSETGDVGGNGTFSAGDTNGKVVLDPTRKGAILYDSSSKEIGRFGFKETSSNNFDFSAGEMDLYLYTNGVLTGTAKVTFDELLIQAYGTTWFHVKRCTTDLGTWSEVYANYPVYPTVALGDIPIGASFVDANSSYVVKVRHT